MRRPSLLLPIVAAGMLFPATGIAGAPKSGMAVVPATEASCVAVWNAKLPPLLRHAITTIHASRATVAAGAAFNSSPKPHFLSSCSIVLVGPRSSLVVEADAASPRVMRFSRAVRKATVGRPETNAIVASGGALRLTGVFSS